ncbi:hypothetical protein H0A36_24675 [Endozoicomonas sp. SM1973]|uniref:CBU-0592-like domain-containing protein n=1 Tax=Spartinivicinus marinus TaxID=2994442 RepID=A0A853III5_9GAMM|nr:hypothetical protein [Spartinivicinus marinus]MCX4027368.1 hypothetical protein [Spartinivicinus marinus]NYZ69217.1 hypothetical protein [Spartinivicinus marinus]
MNYYWYDLVGNIGVFLILLCYLFIQMNKLNNDSLVYSLGNLIGAILILISLYFDFNLSAVIIEGAWALISIYGVIQWYKKSH